MIHLAWFVGRGCSVHGWNQTWSSLVGSDWMNPDRFRIGASTLLNDLLMQIKKERSGAYQGPDYFTID